MKNKQTYYRRKGSKIIAEGKEGDKTIFLFVLPDVEDLVNSSLFVQKKQEKLRLKISRLNPKPIKQHKHHPEVRTIDIGRTFKKDEDETNNNS